MSYPLQNFLNPYDWIESDDESESGAPNECDVDQIRIDIVYGILRDWTCIAAGLRGPWTESSEHPLTNVLDGRQPPQSCCSTTVVPRRNTPNSLAPIDPEDSFSISGTDLIYSAREGSLYRSRRRPMTVWATPHGTSPCLPMHDLIDGVSSRKRRRILRDRMITSSPDVLGTRG